jgi:CheY-like chemotaxis protein
MGNSSKPVKKQSMGKKCLLVDDDEDDKEIFSLALAEADPTIDCFIASDGIEALAMLKNESFIPDYIFLDLNMPLMSGKECLSEIRKQPHLRQVPVIIFSTSSSQKDIQDTKDLGASSFITKPPLISTLAEKLSQVFTSPFENGNSFSSDAR